MAIGQVIVPAWFCQHMDFPLTIHRQRKLEFERKRFGRRGSSACQAHPFIGEVQHMPNSMVVTASLNIETQARSSESSAFHIITSERTLTPSFCRHWVPCK
ncbi:hypothetical protein A15D_01513 [Alcanivorax sp. MD8A]|nr:hypothetical protein A15D_01513 [Alcanivorax sp. MD8A]